MNTEVINTRRTIEKMESLFNEMVERLKMQQPCSAVHPKENVDGSVILCLQTRRTHDAKHLNPNCKIFTGPSPLILVKRMFSRILSGNFLTSPASWQGDFLFNDKESVDTVRAYWRDTMQKIEDWKIQEVKELEVKLVTWKWELFRQFYSGRDLKDIEWPSPRCLFCFQLEPLSNSYQCGHFVCLDCKMLLEVLQPDTTDGVDNQLEYWNHSRCFVCYNFY